MPALKIFLYLIIFAISSWIGILYSKKYAYRVNELKKMKNALNICKTKMKFTYEPIPEIFKYIESNMDGNVKKVFQKACENIKNENAGEAWNKAIDNTELNISKEDKEVLKSLGKLLGKTSLEGQISEIELTSQFLDMQIKKAELEQNKNEKLYKTLGLVGGLGLVIILI